MSESQQQKAVVQYFRMQYKFPKYLIFAAQNGAHLAGTPTQRAIKIKNMKEEGMQVGIPDLTIPVAKGGYHGLVIEMKDIGKTEKSLSAAQKSLLLYFDHKGWKSTWCAGADQAIKVIDDYMRL